MSLTISAATPVQQVSASSPAPASTSPAIQSQLSVDTVTLSQSAQVIQLEEQGQPASQIALDLGIPVSTVDADLGITTTGD